MYNESLTDTEKYTKIDEISGIDYTVFNVSLRLIFRKENTRTWLI